MAYRLKDLLSDIGNGIGNAVSNSIEAIGNIPIPVEGLKALGSSVLLLLWFGFLAWMFFYWAKGIVSWFKRKGWRDTYSSRYDSLTGLPKVRDDDSKPEPSK